MIWGVQQAVKRSVQELVEVSDKFNNLSGVVQRLEEFETVLQSLPVPDFVTSSGVCLVHLGLNG